jgi:plasmid stabilization system protein ParE
MSLPVRVTRRAERDSEAIFEWISARSPRGARRWYEVFLDTLRALPATAMACELAPESETCGRDVRQTLFKTRHGRVFRALFVVDAVIHAVAVRGGGQDFAATDELELP